MGQSSPLRKRRGSDTTSSSRRVRFTWVRCRPRRSRTTTCAPCADPVQCALRPLKTQGFESASMDEHSYDAIVVGTGISGGWAAKELTEKGLKTLVLDRGRMVRHGDYPTAMKDP